MSSTRARVRPAAVAGAFYPVRADTLAAMVDEVLAAVAEAPAAAGPKALIVPHAGYIYSAPVAATAYAQLLPVRDRIERVVLLGPAHRVPVRSMAVSGADAWATPLGSVAVDRAGRDTVLAVPGAGVVVDDEAHAPEHSLEVHVPFLQRVLGPRFTLLPIIVGGAAPGAVADVLDAVWGGDETLIVISTDLSHYHEYRTAQRLDAATAEAIVARSIDFGPDRACGAYPVRGMLVAAQRHGLAVELVDLRNSGDTAGPRDQVVGYGAFVLRPDGDGAGDDDDDPYTAADKQTLLQVARDAIEAHFTGVARPLTSDLPARLREPGASFVTLRDHGVLLGCIGTITPVRALAEDVAENAVGAAFHDPRFAPLTPEEFARASLHISVLTPLQPMAVANLAELRAAVRPHVDGLLVEAGPYRGTFLPAVWEQVPDPDDFLHHLWLKAGMRPGTWPAGLRVSRYQSIEWGDSGPARAT